MTDNADSKYESDDKILEKETQKGKEISTVHRTTPPLPDMERSIMTTTGIMHHNLMDCFRFRKVENGDTEVFLLI